MENKELKPIKDLLIEDVLEMTLFYNNVSFEVKDIWNRRQDARKELGNLKSHPIDSLNKKGYLDPVNFIECYANILNKSENTLSSQERKVISTLGNTAFNKTMQQLIDDEKKRDKDNGKD